MKSSKLVLLLCLCLAAPFAGAGDIYLEGISMMGTKKKAFLSVDGQKMTVEPGEIIADEWLLSRVEQRSIFLRKLDEEGQPAEAEQELILHSRLAEDATADSGTVLVGPDTFKQLAPEGSEVEKPRPSTFKPRRIPPEEVPEGHKVLRTPFGDVLVKSREGADNLPSPPPLPSGSGNTPPTPFGNN